MMHTEGRDDSWRRQVSGRGISAARFVVRALLLLFAVAAPANAASATLLPGAPESPADVALVEEPEIVPASPPADPANPPGVEPRAEGTAPESSAAAATPAAPRRSNAPQAPSTRKVKLNQGSYNVVRTGPGERFSIVGVYGKDATFPVIAKKDDWYNIRVSESETGWIHASLCEVFDDMSDLEFKPNPKLYSRTGSYVLSGYAGGYAFDRKSNSLVFGGRLGYYLFDRVQGEVGVAWTYVQRPAEIVESLFGLELEAEKFHMLFYELGLTFEVLPGRQMVPYVTGGVGSTIMQGRSEPSFNFGAGTQLFLSKRTSMRWEVRNYRFSSGPDDARVSNNNIAFTLGTSLLF